MLPVVWPPEFYQGIEEGAEAEEEFTEATSKELLTKQQQQQKWFKIACQGQFSEHKKIWPKLYQIHDALLWIDPNVCSKVIIFSTHT